MGNITRQSKYNKVCTYKKTICLGKDWKIYINDNYEWWKDGWLNYLYFAPFPKCSTINKHCFCNLKITCLKTNIRDSKYYSSLLRKRWILNCQEEILTFLEKKMNQLEFALWTGVLEDLRYLVPVLLLLGWAW